MNRACAIFRSTSTLIIHIYMICTYIHIQVGRICGHYEERHHILTTRLLKQGYKYDQLCSYFKRFSSGYLGLNLR